MSYEEYRRIMESTDSNGIAVLIRFAMKHPGVHVQYMKRYAEEKKGC